MGNSSSAAAAATVTTTTMMTMVAAQPEQQDPDCSENRPQKDSTSNATRLSKSPHKSSNPACVVLTRSNSIALLEAITIPQQIFYLVLGLAVGILLCVFAVTFPLWLFPAAAIPTYVPASYLYQANVSHFDNTVWTYGTDYLIAVAMVFQIRKFPATTTTSSSILSWRSRALLASYACSVTFGGLCHQGYTTLASRNTWHFRLLWTLCVGSVTAGVAALGSVATELVRYDEVVGLAWLPAVPAWCWVGTGITTTAACAAGMFSYQRPACDIFVAGVAQSIPIFYLLAQLARGLPTYVALDRTTRYRGIVAFIMMSATLPTYPLAVQYTDWTLGTVNALLHVWLCVAWSLQGMTLRRIVEVINMAQQEQPNASCTTTNGTVPAMIPLKRRRPLHNKKAA